MLDFLLFRRFIALALIPIVFWIGVIAGVVGLLAYNRNDSYQHNTAAAVGIFIGFLLYWRLICELFIVIFRINGSLGVIKNSTLSVRGPDPGGSSSVAVATAPTGPEPGRPPGIEPVVAEGSADASTTTFGFAAEPSASWREQSAASEARPDDEGVEPPAAGPALRFCRQCGTEVPPGDRFCQSCGSPIGNGS